MPQKQKINLYILLLLCIQMSFSQETQSKKDSTEVYDKIQTYSKKNKATNFLHNLIFEPIHPKEEEIKKEVQKSFREFEGKIIRNINITTLDPFGYSEIDSTKKPKSWVQKNGNILHIKTKKLAIQNLLLIKKNEPLDSLLVKESERLIRAQSYISRVAFSMELIAKNADSVDVNVRVLDNWSIIPNGALSTSNFNLDIRDHNFMGIGHTFDGEYKNRFSDSKKAYNFGYTIPSIKNTFIQTSLNYYNDLDNYYGKSINIDRPFYSPFAKWAGGIYLDQKFRKDTLTDSNLIYAKQNFKYNSQDFWIGHAFRILKGNTETDRTTNIILSGRFLNIKYLESPTIDYDPIDFYSSQQFFLSGIGLSMRKFVVDKYIFKNGVPEDVPIGKIYGIISGYQYKNNVGRFYLGSRFSFGKYYKFGFLSLNFEMGTFFNKSVTEQTAFSLRTDYFTNLIDIGKWKLRQFVKPQLIIGINRQNAIGDQLTINGDFGIRGFNSAVYGTQKMILSFQTQAYSTWNLWGFRLNPYFNYTVAMLGNATRGLRDSKAFSKIGIGFLITNDYLVFRNFQISLAFFPTIPGNGNNIFKTNSFETTDFGFQDFGFDKPRTVIYK